MILTEKPRRETKHYFNEYLMHNGKVYRRLTNGGKAWAVPWDADL